MSINIINIRYLINLEMNPGNLSEYSKFAEKIVGFVYSTQEYSLNLTVTEIINRN